jgi:ABC-2 type transport system ATP-binding protein
VIDVVHLTKRYGDKLAVDDLTFQVRPGTITGFLGPNGAGKSTTMRMMVGLDAPTTGAVTIDGRAYRDLPAPLREVGTMLEARAIHTGRSAYHHLLAMAQTAGIRASRADEVIELVGLGAVARQRVASGSDSLPRCWATPAPSSSMSLQTAWTPRAFWGSATC